MASDFYYIKEIHKLTNAYKDLPAGTVVAPVGTLKKWIYRTVEPTQRYEFHWRFGAKVLKAHWQPVKFENDDDFSSFLLKSNPTHIK